MFRIMQRYVGLRDNDGDVFDIACSRRELKLLSRLLSSSITQVLTDDEYLVYSAIMAKLQAEHNLSVAKSSVSFEPPANT